MGPVSAEPLAGFVPFLAGEASYTWPQIDGYNANFQSLANVTSTVQNQGWGGRFAAGLMHAMSDRFAYSAEMGWGYYGHVNLEPRFTVSNGAQVIPPANTIGASMDGYGFDMLAGILYTQPKYDLFFKAGALFENLHVNMSVDPRTILRNNRRAENFVPGSTLTLNRNMPQVMPEIKLGGAYHVTENWSATIAWMHAFGGSLGLSAGDLNLASNSVRIGDITANLNSPTLNSVMFGLEYRFA
jgi:hypothetical protein